MLLQTLLASHLILGAGSAVVSAPPPQDESITLPITWSEQRSARFVSLLPQNPSPQSPSPSANSTAANPQAKIPASPPSPAQAAAAKLRDDFFRHYGNVVTVHLQSLRIIEGKLTSCDDKSFFLQTSGHAKPVEIRYSEIVGRPKFRPSADQIVGRTLLVAGCILAIPAAPFFLLALATGAISD
jgi:hypothetical protein